MKVYLAVAGVWLVGCVTTKPLQKPEELPATILSQFGACAPRDGTSIVSLSELKNVEVGWSSAANPTFEGEAVDPVGRTLASVALTGSQVRFRGQPEIEEKLQEYFHNLKIEKDQLLYNGRDTGLRLSELGCLVAGIPPAKWLRHGFLREVKGDRQQFAMLSDGRDISLQLSPVRSCATIVVRHFLGLIKRELNWCFEKKSDSSWQSLASDNWNVTWENPL